MIVDKSVGIVDPLSLLQLLYKLEFLLFSSTEISLLQIIWGTKIEFIGYDSFNDENLTDDS